MAEENPSDLELLILERERRTRSAPQQRTDMKVFGASMGNFAQPEVGEKFVNTVEDAGIRGGPAAAGQMMGAATGPFAEVAVPVLGGIGAVIGEVIANKREGVPTTFNKLASAIISGIIPGGPIARSAGQVAKRAAIEGGLGLATTELQSMADTGEAASPAQAAVATVGGAAAGALGATATREAASLSERQVADTMKREVAKKLQPSGFVVPPHLLGNGTLASDAGKTAIEQAASIRNAIAGQKDIRAEIGLERTPAPIAMRENGGELNVEKEFDRLRAEHFEPYKKISDIQDDAMEKLAVLKHNATTGHDLAIALSTEEGKKLVIQAAADVDALKQFRKDAQIDFERFKGGDPAAFDSYKSNLQKAEAMEDVIDAAAVLKGDDSLLKQLKESRKKIAQIYAVDNATSRSSGQVDTAYLGKIYEAKAPLTGKLRDIARFAADFPEAVRPLGSAAGVGNLRGVTGTGMMMSGTPHGAAVGAITKFGGGPMRTLLLSDTIQRGMLSPTQRIAAGAELARFTASQAKNSEVFQDDTTSDDAP